MLIYDECKLYAKFMMFSAVVIIIAVCIFCLIQAKLYNYAEINFQNEYEEKIEQGYETYIDGQQVDGSKLELSRYYITIDDESRVIRATRK